jgi:hypothetical protein
MANATSTDGLTRPSWLPIGHDLNINHASLSSPGDFLPRGATLGASSHCLVPSLQRNVALGWNGLERPLLGETVDLITGLPLVQVTDLELPMGGATFRLTRTRSGERLFQHWGPNHVASRPMTPAAQHWWDWTGTGWMMSEAPLLFVDSALPDVVGQSDGNEDSPKIWLALDAHHSIPFSRIEETGQYEAPPRFRAVLRHNGVNWHVEQNTNSPYFGQRVWEVRPTEFRISLYEGAIAYVFSVDYADMPLHESLGANQTIRALPANDRPILPSQNDADFPNFGRNPWAGFQSQGQQVFMRGNGLPYLGYLARVEDRSGHVARIHYCNSAFRNVDDPVTESCVECIQNCVQKGRISHITLEQGENVLWTLVYAYRQVNLNPGEWPFQSPIPEDLETEDVAELLSYQTSPVLDRVYAFPGTVGAMSSGACLTLSTLTDAGFESTADPIAIYNAAHPGAPIDEEWLHSVRYYYGTYFDSVRQLHMIRSQPLLIATETISRKDEQDENAKHSWRIFWYQGASRTGDTGSSSGSMYTRPLAAIFEDADIRRLNAARESVQGTVGERSESQRARLLVPVLLRRFVGRARGCTRDRGAVCV